MGKVKGNDRWRRLSSNLRWFWVDTMDQYKFCKAPVPVTLWQKLKRFAYAVKLSVRDLLFEDAMCDPVKSAKHVARINQDLGIPNE